MEWKTHLERAVEIAGSREQLAETSGLSLVGIRRLLSRGDWGQKNMSPRSARKISAAVNNKVTRAQLCPHVYGEVAA